ncbi:MAG: hypothetical protein PVG30_09070 [Gammaproteobacteria bacterium]
MITKQQTWLCNYVIAHDPPTPMLDPAVKPRDDYKATNKALVIM